MGSVGHGRSQVHLIQSGGGFGRCQAADSQFRPLGWLSTVGFIGISGCYLARSTSRDDGAKEPKAFRNAENTRNQPWGRPHSQGAGFRVARPGIRQPAGKGHLGRMDEAATVGLASKGRSSAGWTGECPCALEGMAETGGLGCLGSKRKASIHGKFANLAGGLKAKLRRGGGEAHDCDSVGWRYMLRRPEDEGAGQ